MKNNMSNDDETYLWDKAGEPDPEIQELKRVLGTLRYQPRQLVIPESLKIDSQRSSFWNFGPRLAIAATIILAVGAAAIWLSLGRRANPELSTADTKPAAVLNSDRAAITVHDDVPNEVHSNVPGGVPANTPSDPNPNVEQPRSLGNRVNAVRRNRSNETSETNVGNANRRRIAEPATPLLAGNELKEAEAGKAKLMLALRVASAKLNFALRKTQGSNNPNLIQNQHKIG